MQRKTRVNDPEVERALLKGLQAHNWIEVSASIVGGRPGNPAREANDICPVCTICDTCGLKACDLGGSGSQSRFNNCPQDAEDQITVDRGVINAIKTRIRYLEEIGHSKKTS